MEVQFPSWAQIQTAAGQAWMQVWAPTQTARRPSPHWVERSPPSLRGQTLAAGSTTVSGAVCAVVATATAAAAVIGLAVEFRIISATGGIPMSGKS